MDNREYARPSALPEWMKDFAEAELRRSADGGNPFQEIRDIFRIDKALAAVDEKVSELKSRVGLDKLEAEADSGLVKAASLDVMKIRAEAVRELASLASKFEDEGNVRAAQAVDRMIARIGKVGEESEETSDGAFWVAHGGINWTWFTLVRPEQGGLRILANDRLHIDRDAAAERALSKASKASVRLVEDDERNAVEIDFIYQDKKVPVVNPANVFSYPSFSDPSVRKQIDTLVDEMFRKKDDPRVREAAGVPKELEEHPKLKTFIDNVCASRGGHISVPAVLKMIRDERPETVEASDELRNYIKSKLSEEKDEVDDGGDDLAGRDVGTSVSQQDKDDNNRMFDTPGGEPL